MEKFALGLALICLFCIILFLLVSKLIGLITFGRSRKKRTSSRLNLSKNPTRHQGREEIDEKLDSAA